MSASRGMGTEALGGGSSAHSLRTRWTPLHTHFLGRCVEEHNQLMAALNRAMTDAGPHSNLNSNAKVRGLFQALLQRKESVYEFIARHRQLYGDVDGSAIASFEALLDRLHAVDERVQAWDQRGPADSATPRALTPRSGNHDQGPRKTITFSPSADVPSAARHAVSRPSARQPPRDVTNHTQNAPSMHDIMSSFNELERIAAIHESNKPHLHNAPRGSRVCDVRGPVVSSQQQVFAPTLGFGKLASTSLPATLPASPGALWNISDHSNAHRSVVSRSEPASSSVDVPRPPRGFLYDFSVESEEVKRRIIIQHDEFIAFDALRFQLQRGAMVSVPNAPFSTGPSTDMGEVLQSLLNWQKHHTWRRKAALRIGFGTALLFGAYMVVVLLLEVEAMLDTMRPHGRPSGGY